MATRVTYMNVPATRPAKDESFEERRVLDYIHAYTTTGRPPAPVPQQPTDATQRAALGLLPLFQPLTELEGAAVASTSGVGAPSGSVNGVGTSAGTVLGGAAATNFAAQAFAPTKTQEYGADSTFFAIVAQPEYTGYSFEELRVQAYKIGKKFSDVPPAPTLPRPALLPSIALSTSASAQPDSLQSVNSMPPYDQHSFEELRLACVRAGRPLTSQEIITQKVALKIGV